MHHPRRSALHAAGNLFFSLFVLCVIAFTFLAATSRHDDSSALRTGKDFLNSSDSPAPRLSDLPGPADCDAAAPVDCDDPEVFNLIMRAAIESFQDIHFYRFGRPAPAGAGGGGGCDVAWRFRPKDARRAAFYKDYRRFEIVRAPNCTYSVVKIGDYHSGVNARRKRRKKPESNPREKADGASEAPQPLVEPEVGEAVNDTLPAVASDSKFCSGKYLIYVGGGDRCKSMNHYLWSFLCSLGEAQYLNRTLVMDLSICLSSMYTSWKQDEEGKDFRFYFDYEHLRNSAPVIDQQQFWNNWAQCLKKDRLSLHLVEDFRVTPMKLSSVKDALVMRKFGAMEPDNYWYRVCEGDPAPVIRHPWHLLRKSRHLLDIVSGIASKLNWDFDSVHVVRGEKATNIARWPNLAAGTSPGAMLMTLHSKINNGRHLYIATDELDTLFFDPLKDRYTTHFLDDFKELWAENSEWYSEMKSLNNGVPVEFDGYMRGEVDVEVFLRGKKQIETFNNLTSDCKGGINTCKASSS